MIARTCGECSACCKTHGVLSLLKPAQVMCKHCTSAGCGIYLSRPIECRHFKCLWLEGMGSDLCRPDKTGVVGENRPFLDIPNALWLREVWEGALDLRFAKEWTRRNLLEAFCVIHVRINGTGSLYLPPGVEPTGEEFVFEDGKTIAVIPFAQSEFFGSH